MAKKRKTPRPSRKNLPQNTEWLEDRLNGMMLDIDALSSMPIEDVKAELEKIAPGAPDLSRAIDERLPEGISLHSSASKSRRRRASSNAPARKNDRQAASRAAENQKRAATRWFSLRNALILSAIIILGAIFIPQGIRLLRNAPPDPASAVILDETSPADAPPTWLEGPGANELVRGVRYTVEGLEQIVILAPLPKNPGTYEAVLRFEITVGADGKVVKLGSLGSEFHDVESAVMDSLLEWRFSPLDGDTTAHTGTVTVEFEPWYDTN